VESIVAGAYPCDFVFAEGTLAKLVEGGAAIATATPKATGSPAAAASNLVLRLSFIVPPGPAPAGPAQSAARLGAGAGGMG
jgi:hypothetical protein